MDAEPRLLSQPMKILKYGDVQLHKPADPVQEWTRDHHRIVQGMDWLMSSAGGIGLAATQIGHNEAFFVTRMEKFFQVYINPVILEQDKFKFFPEGCLSFPDATAFIRRPTAMLVKYQVPHTLEEVTVELSGLQAHVFSHESDHLKGILMTDRMQPGEKDEFIRRYERTVRDRRNRNLSR